MTPKRVTSVPGLFGGTDHYDENGKNIRSIFNMMDKNGKMKEITTKSHPEVVKELDGLTSPDFKYVKNIFDAIY